MKLIYYTAFFKKLSSIGKSLKSAFGPSRTLQASNHAAFHCLGPGLRDLTKRLGPRQKTMSSLSVKSPTLPSKSSVHAALRSVDHYLCPSMAVGVGPFTRHHSTMDLDNAETAYPCGFQHCLGPWGPIVFEWPV